MSEELFPNPNHNHRDCKSIILAQAEAFCAANGLRLTKLRRDVLMEIADNHKAIGAYQILERFADRGRALAPISVYRSLDFLQSAGLIHRLESVNAYFACQRHLLGEGRANAETDKCGQAETLIFLVCDECGTVGEVHKREVSELVPQIAAESSFHAESSQMEINGLCRNCQNGS